MVCMLLRKQFSTSKSSADICLSSPINAETGFDFCIGTVRVFGFVQSVWRRGPSAGQRATVPAFVCGRKSYSYYYTGLKALPGNIGIEHDISLFSAF
jgi:hypothetical protein